MPARPRDARTLLAVLFAIYLVLLVWVILWKLETPFIGGAAFRTHPIKLVPFLPSGDAGASDPLEVLANVLFFVPFGLYLGMLAPRWRWWAAASVLAGASLVLEIAQDLLSIGSFDISDVISNTVGGIAGLGILALVRRRIPARAPALMTRILVVVTVLSLVAAAVYIASPLRYRQQPDVVVVNPR